jgi:hypothetical protein
MDDTMSWQPIETAPKDGADILVATTWSFCGEELSAVWVDFSIGLNEWPVYQGRIDIPLPPSHWMPLPAPPSA